MNTIEKLEQWNNGHKARSVDIHIDNGYGATCWTVTLYHEHGITYGTEVLFMLPLDLTYEQTAIECEKDGWVVAQKTEDEDWAGLEKTILATLDGFDRGVWIKKEVK